MNSRQEFEDMLERAQRNWFDWFVTLSIPRVAGPKWNGCYRGTDPGESFQEWMGEIRDSHGRGPKASDVFFVRVEERRGAGNAVEHVILSGVPAVARNFWRHRWWEITAGAAWERPVDGEIHRLIRYFFYKKRFDVEFSIGYESEYCRARPLDE